MIATRKPRWIVPALAVLLHALPLVAQVQPAVAQVTSDCTEADRKTAASEYDSAKQNSDDATLAVDESQSIMDTTDPKRQLLWLGANDTASTIDLLKSIDIRTHQAISADKIRAAVRELRQDSDFFLQPLGTDGKIRTVLFIHSFNAQKALASLVKSKVMSGIEAGRIMANVVAYTGHIRFILKQNLVRLRNSKFDAQLDAKKAKASLDAIVNCLDAQNGRHASTDCPPVLIGAADFRTAFAMEAQAGPPAECFAPASTVAPPTVPATAPTQTTPTVLVTRANTPTQPSGLVLESFKLAPGTNWNVAGDGKSASSEVPQGHQQITFPAPDAIPAAGASFTVTLTATASVGNLATECEAVAVSGIDATATPGLHASAFSEAPGKTGTREITITLKPRALNPGATAELDFGCFSNFDVHFFYKAR